MQHHKSALLLLILLLNSSQMATSWPQLLFRDPQPSEAASANVPLIWSATEESDSELTLPDSREFGVACFWSGGSAPDTEWRLQQLQHTKMNITLTLNDSEVNMGLRLRVTSQPGGSVLKLFATDRRIPDFRISCSSRIATISSRWLLLRQVRKLRCRRSFQPLLGSRSTTAILFKCGQVRTQLLEGAEIAAYVPLSERGECSNSAAAGASAALRTNATSVEQFFGVLFNDSISFGWISDNTTFSQGAHILRQLLRGRKLCLQIEKVRHHGRLCLNAEVNSYAQVSGDKGALTVSGVGPQILGEGEISVTPSEEPRVLPCPFLCSHSGKTDSSSHCKQRWFFQPLDGSAEIEFFSTDSNSNRSRSFLLKKHSLILLSSQQTAGAWRCEAAGGQSPIYRVQAAACQFCPSKRRRLLVVEPPAAWRLRISCLPSAASVVANMELRVVHGLPHKSLNIENYHSGSRVSVNFSSFNGGGNATLLLTCWTSARGKIVSRRFYSLHVLPAPTQAQYSVTFCSTNPCRLQLDLGRQPLVLPTCSIDYSYVKHVKQLGVSIQYEFVIDGRPLVNDHGFIEVRQLGIREGVIEFTCGVVLMYNESSLGVNQTLGQSFADSSWWQSVHLEIFGEQQIKQIIFAYRPKKIGGYIARIDTIQESVRIRKLRAASSEEVESSDNVLLTAATILFIILSILIIFLIIGLTIYFYRKRNAQLETDTFTLEFDEEQMVGSQLTESRQSNQSAQQMQTKQSLEDVIQANASRTLSNSALLSRVMQLSTAQSVTVPRLSRTSKKGQKRGVSSRRNNKKSKSEKLKKPDKSSVKTAVPNLLGTWSLGGNLKTRSRGSDSKSKRTFPRFKSKGKNVKSRGKSGSDREASSKSTHDHSSKLKNQRVKRAIGRRRHRKHPISKKKKLSKNASPIAEPTETRAKESRSHDEKLNGNLSVKDFTHRKDSFKDEKRKNIANQVAINHGEVDQDEIDHGEVDQDEIDHGEVDQDVTDEGEIDQSDTDHNQTDQSEVDADEVDQGETDQIETDQAETDQDEVDQGKVDQAKVDPGKVDQGEVDQGKDDQGEFDQGDVDQGETDQIETDQGETYEDEIDPNETDQYEADQDEADQDEADQDEADQDEADHDEADQDEADQGEADQDEADQGEADQGEEGQGKAGQVKAGKGEANLEEKDANVSENDDSDNRVLKDEKVGDEDDGRSDADDISEDENSADNNSEDKKLDNDNDFEERDQSDYEIETEVIECRRTSPSPIFSSELENRDKSDETERSESMTNDVLISFMEDAHMPSAFDENSKVKAEDQSTVAKRESASARGTKAESATSGSEVEEDVKKDRLDPRPRQSERNASEQTACDQSRMSGKDSGKNQIIESLIQSGRRASAILRQSIRSKTCCAHVASTTADSSTSTTEAIDDTTETLAKSPESEEDIENRTIKNAIKVRSADSDTEPCSYTDCYLPANDAQLLSQHIADDNDTSSSTTHSVRTQNEEKEAIVDGLKNNALDRCEVGTNTEIKYSKDEENLMSQLNVINKLERAQKDAHTGGKSTMEAQVQTEATGAVYLLSSSDSSSVIMQVGVPCKQEILNNGQPLELALHNKSAVKFSDSLNENSGSSLISQDELAAIELRNFLLRHPHRAASAAGQAQFLWQTLLQQTLFQEFLSNKTDLASQSNQFHQSIARQFHGQVSSLKRNLKIDRQQQDLNVLLNLHEEDRKSQLISNSQPGRSNQQGKTCAQTFTTKSKSGLAIAAKTLQDEPVISCVTIANSSTEPAGFSQENVEHCQSDVSKIRFHHPAAHRNRSKKQIAMLAATSNDKINEFKRFGINTVQHKLPEIQQVKSSHLESGLTRCSKMVSQTKMPIVSHGHLVDCSRATESFNKKSQLQCKNKAATNLRRNVTNWSHHSSAHLLQQLLPSIDRAEDGTIKQKEGAIKQKQGTIKQEGTIKQKEGTIMQKEGTIMQKEGTIKQKEGTIIQKEEKEKEIEMEKEKEKTERVNGKAKVRAKVSNNTEEDLSSCWSRHLELKQELQQQIYIKKQLNHMVNKMK